MYGVSGSGREAEAAKLFCIYMLRYECGRRFFLAGASE